MAAGEPLTSKLSRICGASSAAAEIPPAFFFFFGFFDLMVGAGGSMRVTFPGSARAGHLCT